MTYELIEEEEPQRNLLEKVGRQAGRTVASGVTGFVGGIGDLSNLSSRGLEKVGAISPESGKEFRERTMTTEKTKEGLQEQFPSLKPENKVEKFADDVFETLGALANPFTRLRGANLVYSGIKKFVSSIGANLGKEITDQITGEEGSTAGQYVKAGILFLSSILDPKAAVNEATRRYKEAEKFLPPGANVSSKKLVSKLDTIEKDLTKGRPKQALSNQELFVIDKIDKARNLENNGQVAVDQLVAQKKSLNQDLSNLFPEFGQTGSKTVRNQAKRVNGALNEAIDEYGSTNPQYLKNLRAGDEIYATLAQAEGFSRWVKQTFPHSPWSRAGLLFGEKTVGQIPKLLYKVQKSPEMRNLYAKAIAKAGAEDSREFAKIMDQLDKKLMEEESKEYWEPVD